MKHLLQILSLAVLVLTLSAPARAGGDGRVPMPHVPAAAKGERCVEDTAVMRRQHMDFLKHQRDETMRRGIRTEKHSLKQCIECHVPAEGAAAANGEGHFCMNCHAYVGVTLDCFECHATKPGQAEISASGTPAVPSSAELLDQMAENHENKTGAVQ